jgi:putative addiction module component (TIGR02574 family)
MPAKTAKKTTKAAKILKDALALPPAERAEIASCLLESLPIQGAIKLHPSWDKEIERRVREVEDGTVKPIPWKVARRQIFGDA